MISAKSGHCLIALLTEIVVLINVYLRSALSLKITVENSFFVLLLHA